MRFAKILPWTFLMLGWYVSAFQGTCLLSRKGRQHPEQIIRTTKTTEQSSFKISAKSCNAVSRSTKSVISTSTTSRDSGRLQAALGGAHHDIHVNGKAPLTHADIVWKIRPHPEQPWTARAYFVAAAFILHAYLQVTKRNIPSVLCPSGGLCQLEAWYEGKQVGRFGITTTPGPPLPLIAQQAGQLFGTKKSASTPTLFVQTAAIQYMVVEPAYRKRQIGSLALQVIAHVHAFQNCDFTLLVADDNGSGKLVDWYERYGFAKAPLLQDLLGSPNQKYGVTMMGPTNATLPENCTLEWW